jgi:leucokinin receptor
MTGFTMNVPSYSVDVNITGNERDDTEVSNDNHVTNPIEINIYKVPPSLIVILSVFYAFIILVALFGNILVIYVVIVSPRMRTVTNFYIANLAFADVSIAMFAIPFQFHAALVQRWDLPQFMCQFCPIVVVFSVNSSIFTLVAIALDRYVKITVHNC